MIDRSIDLNQVHGLTKLKHERKKSRVARVPRFKSRYKHQCRPHYHTHTHSHTHSRFRLLALQL
jgi:hypothetical protein